MGGEISVSVVKERMGSEGDVAVKQEMIEAYCLNDCLRLFFRVQNIQYGYDVLITQDLQLMMEIKALI